jgi:ABC-type multidrug transport system ATPase subunit/pSer/pThr/pTyr-binding forkhead associated (FHA) protein
MAVTLVIRGDGGTQELVIEGEVTIGRSADNTVVLGSPNVSRHHAVLHVDGGQPSLMDLGSANGTRLRGVELEPRIPMPVRDGDEIVIGPFVLQVRQGTSASTAPTPAQAAAGRGATMVAGATAVLAPRTSPKVVVRWPQGAAEAVLDRPRLTLGREPGNDIVVPVDVVSRHHLEFVQAGPGYVIRDLGSVNGIRIGAAQVQEHALADGDMLDIAGVVTIQFLQPGEALVEALPQVEQQLALGSKPEQTIGRSSSNDIQLSHPAVSARHARIIRAPNGQTTIEDLGSTNGTFVNTDRLTPGVPQVLRTGDVIRIGPFRLAYSPAALHQRDESREMGVNVVHLNQRINPQLNLLQDISLSIQPNEFVAVVGVSGAGKSTLLGALSGLRPASDGQVLLNGTPLYAHYESYRTTIGYVPQDDILHKELPVARALEYAAELRLPDDTTRQEYEGRVETVIGQLGLQERRETPIVRLSGGQRKRVSIGAELLTSPGLFFLDEATSGLDPGTEKRLMQLLRGLADEGHTIILITHATQNVMLCDQVAFLAKGGHLAYFGPPDEALTYFGVQSFDSIYEKLEDELSPEEWGRRYRESPLYDRFVRQRLAASGIALDDPLAASVAVPATSASPLPKARTSSAWRQFLILARRYFDIIRRDRVLFLALFLVAPILGVITVGVGGPKVLTPLEGNAPSAMTYLFLGSLFPFLIGALLFVREIVKEIPVYVRERAVALKIWPYLGSKVAVGTLFALYHGIALLVIQALVVDFPAIGIAGYAQLYVTFVLAIVSGVMWALLISAVTSKEEQAMLLVIGIIVLQVVFSGGVVPTDSFGPVGLVLGAITSTNWAFKAMTAAAGITTKGCTGDFSACELPGIAGEDEIARASKFQEVGVDQFGGVLDANVYVAWGAMVAIMAVLAVAIYVLLKRKDTL